MTDVYGFNAKDVSRIGRTVRTVERAAPAVFRRTVAPAIPNVQIGIITQELGSDLIFRGNLFDANMDEMTTGPGSDIEVIVCLAEIPNVAVGNLFTAVKRGQYFRCLGIYEEFATSSDYPSSEQWSSETPSSEAWSTGEEQSSAFWSSNEPLSSAIEPSSDQPSSDTLSSGEEPSSDQPSSDTPSSAALSSGEEPSSDQPSSDALSSGEEPSSDQPSSDTPSSAALSSGETPSSDQPSSDTPSSALPSSGFPSSGETSSGLGSTGLSSDHPSSDAVSSAAVYDCPDELVIDVSGIVQCGPNACAGNTGEAVAAVNRLVTLPKTSGGATEPCGYRLDINNTRYDVLIADDFSGHITISNLDGGWGTGEDYFKFNGTVARGAVYDNTKTCGASNYECYGDSGQVRIF